MTLKEASNTFAEEFRKRDNLCNSPLRSKFLSQNVLDNYLFVEGICKNLRITNTLHSLSFCGMRLSYDSLKILNEALLNNKTLKEFTLNYCLLDL